MATKPVAGMSLAIISANSSSLRADKRRSQMPQGTWIPASSTWRGSWLTTPEILKNTIYPATPRCLWIARTPMPLETKHSYVSQAPKKSSSEPTRPSGVICPLRKDQFQANRRSLTRPSRRTLESPLNTQGTCGSQHKRRSVI